MTDREREFEAAAARHFRAAAQSIDPVTAARLEAGRRRAVAAAVRPSVVPWLPALAATAAGLVAVLVLWRPVQQPALPASDAETVEILMHESDEMFEDDPDFFLWLDVVAVEG